MAAARSRLALRFAAPPGSDGFLLFASIIDPGCFVDSLLRVRRAVVFTFSPAAHLSVDSSGGCGHVPG